MQNADELRELAWVRHVASTGEAREIRVAARLTTGEIAAALHVTAMTVWRWENCQRKPSADVALRYGRLLKSLADDDVTRAA